MTAGGRGYMDSTQKPVLNRAAGRPSPWSFLPFSRSSQSGKAGANTAGRQTLVAVVNPQSAAAEAYRQLRTNIQFSSLDRPCRTIMVTSTSPKEGKTTTLANLAITMAQTGTSVILVDCDLRRPSLHELFGLENSAGLTSLFIGNEPPAQHLQDTGIPNLRVLCCGPLPPNPSELLGSARMGEVIDALKNEASYVLFDSPPVVAVTDAAVLAARMDGVLLVVQSGQTKRDAAKRATALLEKVNARVLGVVLNNVPFDASVNSYYTGNGQD